MHKICIGVQVIRRYLSQRNKSFITLDINHRNITYNVENICTQNKDTEIICK